MALAARREPDIILRTAIPLEATSDAPLASVATPPEAASSDPADQANGVAKEISPEDQAAATAARQAAPEPEQPDDGLPGDAAIDSDAVPDKTAPAARHQVIKERQAARQYRAALEAAVKAKIGDEAWDNAVKLSRDRLVQAERERAESAAATARKAEEARAALQAELDDLRAKAPPPAEPAPDPRPARDQFDDPDAYDEANVAWGKREALRETAAREAEAARLADEAKAAEVAEATRKETETATAAREAELAALHQTWQDRRTAALDKYPDYAEVAEAEPKDGGPTISEAMAAGIMQSDNGPDIAYHLGQNPDVSQRIAALTNPFAQMIEIGKLAERLAHPPRRAAPRPQPLEPVGDSALADTSDAEPSMEAYAARRMAELNHERKPFFPPGDTLMDYNTNTLISRNNNAEPRPSTDLENLRDGLQSSCKAAHEVNAILSEMVTKAHGALGPDGTGKQGPQSVPNGLLGELHEAQADLARLQATTYELIGMLRTVI